MRFTAICVHVNIYINRWHHLVIVPFCTVYRFVGMFLPGALWKNQSVNVDLAILRWTIKIRIVLKQIFLAERTEKTVAISGL